MQAQATYLRPAAVTYAPPPNGNPGIVPPWLLPPAQGAPPAGDHTPRRVMGAANPTVYDPEPPPTDPEHPWQIMAKPQLWIPDQPDTGDPDTPRIM